MDSITLFTAILMYLVAVGFMALLFSFPVMWLWNWLMPSIFGMSQITILEAVGLYFLSAILFKATPSYK